MAVVPKLYKERQKMVRGKKNLRQRVKWFFQTLKRGYSDYDIIFFCDHPMTDWDWRESLDSFINYATEWGFYLPKEFSKDPAEWLNKLRQIQKLLKDDSTEEEKSIANLLFTKYYDDLHD